jgi:rSAM/selenodomain-associated transferase 1
MVPVPPPDLASRPVLNPRVVLFAKAPRPGLVKTRIAADLDAEAAAAIYRVLVQRTLSTLRDFPGELRFTPPDARAEFQPWLPQGWTLVDQGGGDLGARLQRAVEQALQNGSQAVLLLGADCPALEVSDLTDALRALENHDVVLGPAIDGGYWLLGVRGSHPCLFEEMPWGTPSILRLSLERAHEAGLRTRLLRELRDIDTLADWRDWLRTPAKSNEPARPPRKSVPCSGVRAAHRAGRPPD